METISTDARVMTGNKFCFRIPTIANGTAMTRIKIRSVSKALDGTHPCRSRCTGGRVSSQADVGDDDAAERVAAAATRLGVLAVGRLGAGWQTWCRDVRSGCTYHGARPPPGRSGGVGGQADLRNQAGEVYSPITPPALSASPPSALSALGAA